MPAITEQDELVSRIASSPVFTRAPRLRDLLLYITDHADDPRALTEHQIGVHVFGRPETYSPGDDNIVRASARQLRTKLREYFETDGAGESVLLDIPKGAYVPVFAERSPAPAVMPTPPKPVAWMAATAVLAGACVALAVLHWGPSADPDTLFTGFFQAHGGPVRFVMTDSTLGATNSMIGHAPDLEAYASRSYVIEGEENFADDPHWQRLWRTMTTRQITSWADVGVLTRLLQSHPAAAARVEVRHAKHMRTRDFKAGNFVITGSATTNPWASLFEKQLNFQLATPRIINRRPQPGEPAEYVQTGMAAQWAHVAHVKNLSGEGGVLLVEGLQFEGTEGAGEFLLSPESRDEFRRVTGARNALPEFELVLEISAMEGTARTARIAAWRLL